MVKNGHPWKRALVFEAKMGESHLLLRGSLSWDMVDEINSSQNK